MTICNFITMNKPEQNDPFTGIAVEALFNANAEQNTVLFPSDQLIAFKCQ